MAAKLAALSSTVASHSAASSRHSQGLTGLLQDVLARQEGAAALLKEVAASAKVGS
jgi:hypothetical protein